MAIISNIGQGKYFLNNKDMFLEFGLVVTGGSNDILKLPERKEPYSHDWQDENGEEYDLQSPVFFKDKDLTLSCYLVADSNDQFWRRYNLLFDEFKKTGWSELKCTELDATCLVWYKNCTEPNRINRLKGNPGLIAFSFNLTFKCKYTNNTLPTLDIFFFKINGQPLHIEGQPILVN